MSLHLGVHRLIISYVSTRLDVFPIKDRFFTNDTPWISLVQPSLPIAGVPALYGMHPTKVRPV